MRPSPEEQNRRTAEKEAKKAAKKAKYGNDNSNQSMQVVSVVIPYALFWSESGKFYRKDIDIDKQPWASMSESAERNYRFDAWLKTGIHPDHPVKVKISRVNSKEDDNLRRLYGEDIIFEDRTGGSPRVK